MADAAGSDEPDRLNREALTRVDKSPLEHHRSGTRRIDDEGLPVRLPEERTSRDRSQHARCRVDVTAKPRREPFFFVLSLTGLWTNLTALAVTKRLVPPQRVDTQKVSTSIGEPLTEPYQRAPYGAGAAALSGAVEEAHCRVDVQIPGPNVFRGNGVDTHAIDLGGLRTVRHASD